MRRFGIALLGLALILSAACEESGGAPVAPRPIAPTARPASKPPPADAGPDDYRLQRLLELPQDRATWADARPGDFVVFQYEHTSSNFRWKSSLAVDAGPHAQQPGEPWSGSGRVRAEVVAVEPGVAWVELTLQDGSGAQLAYDPLEGPLFLHLPTAAGAAPPLPEGQIEFGSVAGRQRGCVRVEWDAMPVDGPLERRCYSPPDGATYLANGLLTSSYQLVGYGGSPVRWTLSLIGERRGSEGAYDRAPIAVDAGASPVSELRHRLLAFARESVNGVIPEAQPEHARRGVVIGPQSSAGNLRRMEEAISTLGYHAAQAAAFPVPPPPPVSVVSPTPDEPPAAPPPMVAPAPRPQLVPPPPVVTVPSSTRVETQGTREVECKTITGIDEDIVQTSGGSAWLFTFHRRDAEDVNVAAEARLRDERPELRSSLAALRSCIRQHGTLLLTDIMIQDPIFTTADTRAGWIVNFAKMQVR